MRSLSYKVENMRFGFPKLMETKTMETKTMETKARETVIVGNQSKRDPGER